MSKTTQINFPMSNFQANSFDGSFLNVLFQRVELVFMKFSITQSNYVFLSLTNRQQQNNGMDFLFMAHNGTVVKGSQTC